MAYTATSIDVFIAAYSGALGGMRAERGVSQNTNPAHYTHICEVALAFAESFDTEYASILPNELQLQNIETICEEQMSGKQPGGVPPTTAAFWTRPVLAIIALLSESDTIFAANVTNPIPVPAPVSFSVLNVATVVGGTNSLKSIIPTTAVAAIVDGYYAMGDNGGGPFFWDPTSTETDNGGSVINPTGHVGAGRWIAINSEAQGWNVLRWGAKGIGAMFDDSVPVQALLTWALANLHSIRVLFPSVGVSDQSKYYNFVNTVTVQGSFGQSVWIDGEYNSPISIGGASIVFNGAAGTKGVFDLKGANNVEISNIDLHCQSLPKYAIWFRPDQVAPIGGSRCRLVNVSIRNPQNAAGAAAFAMGPEPGPGTNQADNVVLEKCTFIDTDANTAAVGILCFGNNAKLIGIYDTLIQGYDYAYDFIAYSSGPATVIGGGVSGCWTGAFRLTSSVVEVVGWDFETNVRDCKLVRGSLGAGDGAIRFYSCEIEYQDGSLGTATNDIVSDWNGGCLAFYGCTIRNNRTVAISDATNANPIVLTVPAGHGILNGDRIQIAGVTGNTATNTAAGAFTTVTAVGATTVTINAIGNGAYTGGGTIMFEPKVYIADNATTDKSGVDSRQNTWFNCASNLPIFDSTGVRLLDSINAQAKPYKIYSFGDVGFQSLLGGAPVHLVDTFGEGFRLASFANALLTTSSTGTVQKATGSVAVGQYTTLEWDSNGPIIGQRPATDDAMFKVKAGGAITFFDATTLWMYFQVAGGVGTLQGFGIPLQLASTATLSLSSTGNGTTLGLVGEKVGVFGANPIVKPTVTGALVDLSATGALKSFLTALANLGCIVDNSS